jgi:alkanesulfonate monooxygenase SsuD/methylene tetrahydromethanopterin reductase-like flavin-dependent oxidoreductase (luciferase family)
MATLPADHPVRVGLVLTHQYRPDADLAAAVAEQRETLRFVRDRGWDSVVVGQHYLAESLVTLQPLPLLAHAAADSGDMQLVAGIVLLSLVNPVETAENYATLDVLCGGRLVFGVGLGYRDVEYAAFGIDPPDKLKRFTANLDIIRRLWSGESVDADLPWCQLSNAQLTLLPIQRPGPKIWMAAHSDAAVRRAARTADAWYMPPHATTSSIVRQLEVLSAERQKAGLPMPATMPLRREIYCAPTRAQALESAVPYLGEKYRTYSQWGQDQVMPGEGAASFARPMAELENDRFVIGTPEECLEQLLPWTKLGVNHFVFKTSWPGMPLPVTLQSLDLLSREVLPTLRAA